MFDLVYIVCSCFIFSVPALAPGTGTSFAFCYLITAMLPLAHVGLNGWLSDMSLFASIKKMLLSEGSILLTICLALERYITVCFPYFKIGHRWNAKNYMIPVFIISFLYNLPKFFELTVVQIIDGIHEIIHLDFYCYFIV